MAGTINDFKSSFKTDLARPNRFDVSIPVPLPLILYRNASERLTFRCETANLPGRTLATADQKIYNITEKFPYQTTYNDMDLTFIVSDDMLEKEFFDAWMEFINPSTTFNMKYKGDYATTVTISQYDVTNQLSYSIELIDAYPIAVNQLDLDWSSEGAHKLTVVLAYTYWRNNNIVSSLKNIATSGLGGVVSEFTGGLGGSLF
jgi:hypothetical protein